MKFHTLASWLVGAALAAAGTAAHADRLDDIKKAGVLRVATFDSNPPFGYVDGKTNHIVGLDVDYAKALADKLGVKLQLQPTNPANRIPFLTSGKVDLVLANFTITDERAKQVDFSIPYFVGPAVPREEGRAEVGRAVERPAGRRGQGHDERDHAAR